MQNYKDSNDNLYALDSVKFEHLLPEDCVRITKTEADALHLVKNPPYVPSYKDLRAAAYPDIREYLDGVVKGDIEQQKKYLDDCLAVKDLYPKDI